MNLKIIIGQEAICPDGLGRVSYYNPSYNGNCIEIETYINNRSCHWDPINVELIDPRKTVVDELDLERRKAECQ